MARAIAEELWSVRERAAWRPPELLRPSEWAERERTLPRGQSDRPGPYRFAAAPYSRAFADLPVAPGIRQLNVMKPSQAAGSESLRCLIGYLADCEPDPVGLALPDRNKGRKIVDNRIIPMFRSTAALRRHFTERSHDVQKEQIKLLNGFILHLMWSGSPSALAADPIRVMFNDEVDKFSPWSGREANPVALTWDRQRTFGDRAVQVNTSTPTTETGQINQLVEGSDVMLKWIVPCPHCNVHQELVFGNLRWAKPASHAKDRRRLASYVVRNNAVWYECGHCRKRIRPDPDGYPPAEMIRAGRWSASGASIDEPWEPAAEPIDDAEAVEAWPPGTRLAMQFNALIVTWERWANIAAEFIRAGHDYEALFHFYTNTLGLPFKSRVAAPAESTFSVKSRSAGLAPGVVPAWAVKLLLTVDSQHDHFYAVLRAWGAETTPGAGNRSARVWHGQVASFTDLDELAFGRTWQVERDAWPAMRVDVVAIDSGGTRLESEAASRTVEVYRWAIRRQAAVRVIKGASRSREAEGRYIWTGRGHWDPTAKDPEIRRRRSLLIWLIDSHHFNDLLEDRINCGMAEDDDRDQVWFLNSRDDPDYNGQMSNVRKISERWRGALRQIWVPVATGARHDYRDCEVYQMALAQIANIHLLPPAAEVERLRSGGRAKPPAKKSGRKNRDPWAVGPMDL